MVKIVSSVQNSEQLLIKKIAAETNKLIQQGFQIINVSQVKSTTSTNAKFCQGVPNLPIFEPAFEKMKSQLEGRFFIPFE